MAEKTSSSSSFDDNYRKHFVEKIREEFEKTELENEGVSTLRKIATQITDPAEKAKVTDLIKEFEEEESELKAYTLKNLKEDSFMFTDQLHPDRSRGIKGPKEVKERIRKYLADQEISGWQEELACLF